MWRQPNTEQGLGKRHLQRTVNMGKEQSGLFPLGIYSRGNEKKERERDEESQDKKLREDTQQGTHGSVMNGGVSSEESHTGAAQQRPFTHWTLPGVGFTRFYLKNL